MSDHAQSPFNAARLAAGLSLDEAAELLGVDADAVRRADAGSDPAPAPWVDALNAHAGEPADSVTGDDEDDFGGADQPEPSSSRPKRTRKRSSSPKADPAAAARAALVLSAAADDDRMVAAELLKFDDAPTDDDGIVALAVAVAAGDDKMTRAVATIRAVKEHDTLVKRVLALSNLGAAEVNEVLRVAGIVNRTPADTNMPKDARVEAAHAAVEALDLNAAATGVPGLFFAE